MGLGLHLKGRVATLQADWLEKAEDWLQSHCEDVEIETHLDRNDADQPTLFLHLHPSAENVEITQEAAGRIVAAAKTSTTGPGYHIYLCDLLERMGDELDIDWQAPTDDSGDETGYFHSGDREALEQEMLRWLQAMADFVRKHDATGFKIAMPLGHSYLIEDGDQRVLTQLGPREREWFATVADDPSRGVDFFPWWDAELDARYYRDRALCLMWSELRWRPPVNDEEADLLLEVADLLQTAYDLDHAGIELPWAEWHEVLRLIEQSIEESDTDPKLAELVAKRAAQAGPPRIGYRRGPVRVEIVAGWSLDIPGSFAEKWDDEGKTWCAWEKGRMIWFTSFSLGEPGQPLRPAEECLTDMPLEGGGERLEHRAEHVVGKACWGQSEEEGEDMWQLQALTATPGGVALITVCVEDPADKDWAIRTWRSASHPGPDQENAG